MPLRIPSGRRWYALNVALAVVSIPLVARGLYHALLIAPRATRDTGGDVQRIFYFHVPFAMSSFLGFALVLVFSILFLAQGKRLWDTIASAAAEVGLLCCTIVLLTGPVWARYAWGVWWTWDARLTSTLVLWLIYAGYLILRSFMAEDLRMRRYAAVLGIIGALNVPIVYFSVRWFRTQHPTTFINKAGGLDPVMKATLGLGVMAVVGVFLAILSLRLRLGHLEAEAEALRASIEAGEHGA